MRISTKCSMALHLLLIIAVFSPHKRVTSDRMAGSVGCNPVVARSLLSSLKKAGLIEVSRGVGGATLAYPAGEITLWDVYAAVEEAPPETLMGLHPHPLPDCPVGRNIYSILSGPYQQVGDAVKREMSAITLEQMVEEYERLRSEQK